MVVDNKIVGERMEFLRENMGVSQKNLAEYLDISQPYLSQIAAGKRPMSLTILDKLCALFGCSEQYLLGLDDSFHPKSYAFRSKKIDVDLRKDWEIDAYGPLDIFSIVLSKFSKLSILIYPMSKNTSGLCINEENIPIIGINSNHSKGRQKFTLAHELYHLLFEDINDIIICNDDKNDSEVEADSFASFLLMTDEGLRRYMKINEINHWDLNNIIAAEQYFQISHQAFLFRINKLGFSVDEYNNINLSNESKKRGFLNDLYEPAFKEDIPFVLGNYLKMINHIDELGGLSDGKKRELLLDGCRGDLVFNKCGRQDLNE